MCHVNIQICCKFTGASLSVILTALQPGTHTPPYAQFGLVQPQQSEWLFLLLSSSNQHLPEQIAAINSATWDAQQGAEASYP